MSRIDLDSYVGKKYGGYTVKKFVAFKKYKTSRAPMFEVACFCGKVKTVSLWHLRKKVSHSCGCSRVTKAIEIFKESGPRSVIRNYRYQAKQRNYPFELTNEEAQKLITSDCFYCKASPSNRLKSYNDHAEFCYNGIDRLDNTKGYTLENCVACCYLCNRCKSDLSYEAFTAWIAAVSNNLKLK